MKNSEKTYLPMNLQYFAEDPPLTDPPADPPSDPPKSFDDLLKDKSMQSEFDKRIAKALETAKGKWEKDYQTKLEEAKTEAEKLAKMNADQKAEYERKKHEETLSKREGEITRRELRATALESLAEKGLPKQLADILDYSNAESTSKSIESVEKVFRDSIEAAVNERLKGDPPKGGGGKGNDGFDAIKQIFAQR